MYNGNDHGGDSHSQPKPETKPPQGNEPPAKPLPPHEDGKKAGQ